MQMILPGSAMGACRRSVLSGACAHSVIDRIASRAAGPASRNARVLGGNTAAAVPPARPTPLPARAAAVAAVQSAGPSPARAGPGRPSPSPQMRQPPLMMPAPPVPHRYQAAYQAVAAVATLFSLPGRAVLCTAGSALSLVTMLVTFGSGYGAAKGVFEESCIGKWIVTPDDLRAANRRGAMGDAY